MSRGSDPARAREIFLQALPLEREERERYLRHACDGDAALHADVSTLLEATELRPDFLEAPMAARVPAPAPETVEASPLVPGTRVDEYEIESCIGRGGMGVVYRARDTKLDRRVALKFVRSDLRDEVVRTRFLREARAAARLDHANVGTVYGVGEHDGHPYIAMAYYEGQTLAQRIQLGQMAIPDALRILRQLASGLSAAHAAGIVHRDLKPSNVVLAADGSAKIMDFGLARVTDRSGEETSKSTTGAVLGTVAYMSPEQARGGALDARTDVWSLGVVAHEMLTGRTPFEAGSTGATFARLMVVEPSRPSASRKDAPTWLDGLVASMLSKDPEKRPRDGSEVVQLLDERTFPRRRRRLILAAVTGLLIVGAAVGVAMARRRWSLEVSVRPVAAARVVALPCQVFGGGEDLAFLADAIPTTLTTELGQIPGLTARLPPSSNRWDAAVGDIAVIEKFYEADCCLKCAVTSTEGRLILDLQAIDLGTRRVRWSKRYEGTQQTYVDLVERAAGGVRAALLPGAPEPPTIATSTSRGQAEIWLRRGDYFADRYGANGHGEDLEMTRSAYEKALEIEPSLAPAMMGLSRTYSMQWQFGAETSTGRQEANAWLDRALAADPDCADAWSQKAFIGNTQEMPFAQKLAFALRAARIVTSSCGHENKAERLGIAVNSFSNELAALAEAVAMRQDPLGWIAPIIRARALLRLEKIDEARIALDRAAFLVPESPFVLELEAPLLLREGKVDEARRIIERLRALVSEGRHQDDWRLGELELLLAIDEGRTADIDCLLVAYGSCNSTNELVHRGRYEEAVKLIVECERPWDWGALQYEELVVNHDFDPIRDDPRIAVSVGKWRQRYHECIDAMLEAGARGDLPAYLEPAFEEILRREGRGEPSGPAAARHDLATTAMTPP
ncbi:MAG: protein kinase [Acidobacteriota bacterium]